MGTVLVLTRGFKNELCHSRSVLVSAHCFKPRIYIHEKIYGASNFAAGEDHARLADYSRFAHDEIRKSLRSE